MASKYSFSPSSAAQAIAGYKRDWDKADKEDDENGRTRAANLASKYYGDLEDNGYSQLANNLRSSDAETAQTYADASKAAGMTQVRPYARTLLNKYGLSNKQADDLLTYNDATGEMSLGGVLIGTGDAMVNDSNYLTSDNLKKVDNAVSQWAANSGAEIPASTLYNQNTQNMITMGQDLWDTAKNNYNTQSNYSDQISSLVSQDPTESAIYRDIWDYYLDLGKQSGYDEIASGAGTNGGNVDSYSQANAARQMASFASQGAYAAIQAYTEYLNNSLNALNSAGGNTQTAYNSLSDAYSQNLANNQAIFDNDQTAKNNEVARLQAQAETTGYIPTEWDPNIQNNEYLNADGSFNDEYEDSDFSEMIAEAEARGDEAQAQKLRIARGAKIFSNYEKYGVFDDGNWSSVTPTETAEMRNNAADRENEREISQIAADTTKYQTDAETAQNEYSTNAGLTSSLAESDAKVKVAQAEADADKYGYDKDVEKAQVEADSDKYGVDKTLEATKLQYSSGSDTSTDYTVDEINEILDSAGLKKGWFGKGYEATEDDDGSVTVKLNSDDYDAVIDAVSNASGTDYQKMYNLLIQVFGIPSTYVQKHLND